MATTTREVPPRIDIREKVTGQAIYTEDLPSPPGMLYGQVLLSPYSHARFLSLNAEKAKRLPGVHAVLTGESLGGVDPYRPRRDFGPAVGIPPDQPLLAIDKVRFDGDPVAAVAAETLSIAEQALQLIEVEYEELHTVFDPVKALESGAPLVHEAHGTNLVGEYPFGWGDVEKGFKESDLIVEDTFVFPNLFHYPIENVGVCVATFLNDEVTLLAPIQHLFNARAEIARIFGLETDKIRIHFPYVGGGFGVKELEISDLIALILARQTARPVKMVPPMEESFRSGARHYVVYKAKSGVKSDGTLVAQEIELVVDGGAYLTGSMGQTERAVILAWGGYRVPNLRVVGRCAYTNKVPATAFRSLARAQTTWGYESHQDNVARKLGMDPLEYRLKNLLKRGEKIMDGVSPMDADYAELFAETVKAIGWDGRSKRLGEETQRPEELPRLVRGRGLSTTFRHGYTGTSTSLAEAQVDGTGRVKVLHTAAEIGMGVYNVMARVAAQTLGVPESQVQVSHPDTNYPYSGGIGSSRDTVSMGMAVQRACESLGRELLNVAALAKGGEPEEWRLAEGRLWHGEQDYSFGEVVRTLGGAVVVSGQGFFATAASDSPFQGIVPHWEVSVGAAEVEVDTESGEVRLVQYANACDVGKAIHPQSCKGQLDGGAVMGLGDAMYEEIVYRDGQLLNADSMQYRVPLMHDVPEDFYSLMIEHGDGPGPQGSKGMGQTAVSPIAPAIANAIYEAIGVRITDLPVSPEKVLRALGKL